MRSVLTVLVALLLFSISLKASLQTQLWYCTFYSPNTGPYVEVYLSFQADNLNYQPSEAGFFGEIEVIYTFSKDSTVVKTESFIIQSPEVADTNNGGLNFVNQHRISIPNGSIDMDVSIRDLNGTDEPIKAKQHFDVNYSSEMLALSDIEIYQSAEQGGEGSMFFKHGFKIIPYTYEIVPPDMDQIGFYVELYNSELKLGEGTPFLITYYLEDYESGQALSRYRGHSRKAATKVNVFMGRLLISDLPGGNYSLKIDVLDQNNALLTSKNVAFHKQNPTYQPESYEYDNSFVERYLSADSLEQHIKYLGPISDQLEIEFAENQIIGKDLEMMKKYFLNFWQKRNPADPEQEWYDYLKQVYIVNENFKTPMREGYLSDRGWRYLKYGPPNDRYESFDEPVAYPYEVWYYNKVNKQSNKIIIYYNKSQVLNDYNILHSDINGEIYNKDWNLELHRMNPGYYDSESPAFMDYFGNKTNPVLTRPR